MQGSGLTESRSEGWDSSLTWQRHSCVGAGEKLVLSELLQPIHPKSSLGSVRKELARVKRKAAVELPLSKEEAKRVSAGGSGDPCAPP